MAIRSITDNDPTRADFRSACRVDYGEGRGLFLTYPMPLHLYRQIQDGGARNKIANIKDVRLHNGCGLKEAKDLVEFILAFCGVVFPIGQMEFHAYVPIKSANDLEKIARLCRLAEEMGITFDFNMGK